MRYEGAICLLALSACLRIGYEEQPREPIDAGYANQRDAAVLFDAAGASDAVVSTTDAAISMDAAATLDAAKPADAAAIAMVDAASPADAGSMLDAANPIDAAVGCTPVMRDYCVTLPALPEAPVFDGVLDCGPALIELVPVGWHSSEAYAGDHPARYAAAWRPDGLYVYIEVDDTLVLPAPASEVEPWCGDGIELYVDADGVYMSAPDYDEPGAIQLLATAPARDSSTALAVDARYHTRDPDDRIADWEASRHVAVARANGYALEAFVTAADLDMDSWSLSAGGRLGFDLAINVSVADDSEQVECGYNLGQYYLRLSRTPCSSDNCRPYSNAAAFCTPVLE